MTALDRTRQNGYGYLRGRDGDADETPTQGGYTNNFDTALAASIRGARQSIEHFPDEYMGKKITVYSTGNRQIDINWTTGAVPVSAVRHILIPGA